MPATRPYLRFPSLRGESVCFVADDDLFLARLGDTVARRLTADHAPARHPKLSPDGSLVAYTSRRDGVAEVFVVATDGSDQRRLTYLGDPSTTTIGWTDDGRVLVVSAAGQPFRSRTFAYAVSLTGERERLGYGPVTAIDHGPGGAVVLGVNQNLHRGAAWKRYRGGTAAALWLDREGTGHFERFLTGLGGQLEDPCFVGDRIAFLSDHEGVANLYSVEADASGLRRHSDQAEFYARAASSDGTRVVYQCAGDLFLVGELTADSLPERLEVSLEAPRRGRQREVLPAGEHLGGFSPDHDGRASAVEVRGAVHWLTHRKGPARRLGGGHGVRLRLPRVAGSGESARVVAVTDAGGDDALEVVAAAGPVEGDGRRIGAGQLGRVLELACSPDGRRAAVATHDGRVVLVDLDEASLATLDSSGDGDASGLAFSPDSRLLAWSHAGPSRLRQIKLAVLGGEVVEASPLRFVDTSPAFSADGRFLAFLSLRTFDPVYDAHIFDMSFTSAARPYLVPLDDATPSPFDAEVAGRPRRAPEAPSGGEGEAPATNLVIDGLAERVVPFPVAAGRCSRLSAVSGGFTWLAEPLLGELGEERSGLGAEAARPRLVRFDLEKGREAVLADALDGYAVSGDGRTVVLRDRASLRAVPADHKVQPVPGEEPDPAELVEIDLSRLRVEVDPPAEWTQMYDEAARLMRDHFFAPDMAGVDWDGAVARYRPLLERIATRDDLSELLWEVQGELGASHAYEMPPERQVESERRLGLLGADLEPDGDGRVRVARILPSESSVLAARSPLLAPGVAIHPGDVIVAVDGEPVEGGFGPHALLVGAAGKPVELAVEDGATGERRQVVVEPLADERPLRYQDWVAGRRRAVHAASDGRVGYLHVPDMMANGWAELHRDLRVEVARDGLVVDVRDNGGGHLSQLVLEKLARTVTGWALPRHLAPHTYPEESPRGPMVLVVNEQAGSDGDIVTIGFKQRRLGPVVGMRTWGGVIGIDGRYQLVDGTTVTQPRYPYWFYGPGWGVENHGVDPDVEVPLSPEDWGAGRDPQLERAVELVLEALESHPAARPPELSSRPSRTPPPLPPRP